MSDPTPPTAGATHQAREIRVETIGDHIKYGYEVTVFCGNFRCLRNKPRHKGGISNGQTIDLASFDPSLGLGDIKGRFKCSACGERQAVYVISALSNKPRGAPSEPPPTAAASPHREPEPSKPDDAWVGKARSRRRKRRR